MSLRDYIREMEEKEEKEAVDKIDNDIRDLFMGDDKPTKETIADFAAENDISDEEVEIKIFNMLYDTLHAEEEEEKEEGEIGSEEPVEETPNYFTEEDDEDEESEDEMGEEEEGEGEEVEMGEEEEEEEEENPFEVGDTVKNVTTDTDSIFYGKTYEVAQVDGLFTRVTYIDPDGRQDLVWFKADELKAVEGEKDEDETEDDGLDATGADEGDEEEVKEESFGESYGILGYLKKGLLVCEGSSLSDSLKNAEKIESDEWSCIMSLKTDSGTPTSKKVSLDGIVLTDIVHGRKNTGTCTMIYKNKKYSNLTYRETSNGGVSVEIFDSWGFPKIGEKSNPEPTNDQKNIGKAIGVDMDDVNYASITPINPRIIPKKTKNSSQSDDDYSYDGQNESFRSKKKKI